MHGPGLKKAYANLCALALARPHLGAPAMVDHCEAARRVMPHAPEVLTNLARAYDAAQKKSDAARAFGDALAKHPEHPFVLGHWVGYLVREGRLDEALAAQRRLVRLASAPPSARPNLVALLFQVAAQKRGQGAREVACELAREAQSLAPSVRAVVERAHSLCAGP